MTMKSSGIGRRKKWKTLKAPQVFYAIRYVVSDHNILLVRTRENILSTFVTDIKNMTIAGIGIKLFDDTDKLLYGVDETKTHTFHYNRF